MRAASHGVVTEHDRLNRINEAVQPEFAHLVSTLNIGGLNEDGLRSLLRPLLAGAERGHRKVVRARCCLPALFDRPRTIARCLVPGFDGAVFSRAWKEALWVWFTTKSNTSGAGAIARSETGR